MMRLGDRLTHPHGLTASRWILLCSLKRRGETATVSELAEEQVMSVQGISRMLASMEGEGLVAKETRPGCGRTVFVSLTPRGREAVGVLERLGERFGERFLEGLEGDEIHRLESGLARLIGNLSRYEEELIRDGREPVTDEECA
ncbi:MAG: MarR family winged helix-turn-helix transcriptional regulator [Phycisphaerales bacterium JB040]